MGKSGQRLSVGIRACRATSSRDAVALSGPKLQRRGRRGCALRCLRRAMTPLYFRASRGSKTQPSRQASFRNGSTAPRMPHELAGVFASLSQTMVPQGAGLVRSTARTGPRHHLRCHPQSWPRLIHLRGPPGTTCTRGRDNDRIAPFLEGKMCHATAIGRRCEALLQGTLSRNAMVFHKSPLDQKRHRHQCTHGIHGNHQSPVLQAVARSSRNMPCW